MKRNFVLTWAAVAASLVLGVEARGQVTRGQEFPDFTAKDAITGEQFSLSDLRGKVVLVDFWATWCGPCVRELPNVKRAYSKYKTRGFEIVSVSLDTDKQRFQRFVREKRMSWRHVMEGGGWKTRLARKYGVNSIPRMVVIGPDGVCIDANARGRSLDAAIRKGLDAMGDGGTPVAKDKPREPTRGAPRQRESEPRNRVPIELEAARAALAGLERPLEEVGRRIAELQDEIDGLRRQLPMPKDPARAERRADRIAEGLAELRHTMFMLGLLDEASASTLPSHPETAAGRSSSAWSRLNPFLQAAEQALTRMRDVAADLGRQLDDLESEIRGLESAIADGTASGSVSEQIDGLESQANAIALRLRAPMVTQLEVAGRMIAGCCQPFDDAGMLLGALDSRIAEMREAIEVAPRETQALRSMRDAFAEICTDLAGATEILELDVAQRAITLPTNPFAGRRLKDRRVLAEMAVQVEVAEQAAAALHAVVIERRSRFDELNEQVLILQGEIADRLEAGEPVGDLRPRYAELTQEVLALHDRTGGA
ncbi:MAG: TlpA family protein disulfide reductase [Planctomycetota bacterium]|jgi:peroxiredoxin/TolA-binding protein